MNRPIISVVIPVYNVEAYIERCVNSVRNQTVENIEIILIDDGSPDQSPVLCDQYAEKDRRVRVIHKKWRTCVCKKQGNNSGNWKIYFLFGQ